MQVPFVDLKAQYASLREEVNSALQGVLDETSFILGPPVPAFERDFAKFCGAAHCVSVASGTDALHLALRCLGVGPGDEVVLPAFTFVATALGVSLAGAQPVLVDVQREDGLIDPERIAAAITPRTKAIIPVHLYGRCCDMDAIRAIAESHGLVVVEDACQAHGAAHQGRPAGSLGDAAAFSFYPGKNLGAYGDGGAITTNDAALAERLRLMRNWGSIKKYHHEEVGLNSRLDTLQAAVLGVKLPYLAEWNAARRRHAALYDRLLNDASDIRRIADRPGDEAIYHLYVVRVADRDERLACLHQHGVSAGIHYPFPVHRLNAYRNVARVAGPVHEAEAWAAECLSLPMYPELTEEQIHFVARHAAPRTASRAA